MEIPMPKPAKKSAKKRSPKSKPAPSLDDKAYASSPSPIPRPEREPMPASKQARVIAMLQSPTGTTIAAMMQATGWQQHSVRGFLAGVVRKKLKLKLASKKVDGNRVYRIDGEDRPSTSGRQSKRRAA